MDKSLEIRFIGMFDELEEIRKVLPSGLKHNINPHFYKGKFTGKGVFSFYPCCGVIDAIKKIVLETEIPF